MKINTETIVGTYDTKEDIYFYPDTVIEAHLLTRLFKQTRGRAFEFHVQDGENPALILRLKEVAK